MRKRIISKVRYWHFNALGLLTNSEKHQVYLDFSSNLDEWFNTEIWSDKYSNLEERWSVVLSCLKKCTNEQLLEFDRLIKNVE